MFLTRLLVIAWLAGAGLAQAAEPIERAAERGDTDALRAQLAAGMDINRRYDIGRSALLVSARYGQLVAVRMLVESGADVNLQDNNGDTALHLAAGYHQLDIVKYLLAKGADAQLRNRAGRNVLDDTEMLIRQGDSSLQPIVQYLAKVIPTLPQTRAKSANGVSPTKLVTGIGEPALFVNYVTMDTRQYNTSPEALRQAARRVLQRRGWNIIASESDREVGSYLRNQLEYRVEIRFLPNATRIAFLNGYHSMIVNYLRNLEYDLQDELRLQSRPR